MRRARIREWQHDADVRSQSAALEESRNLRQILRRNVHEEEARFHAVASSQLLIRSGDRRDKPTASAQHLERTRLSVPADQIDDRVCISYELFEALSLKVDGSVGAELAHERN